MYTHTVSNEHIVNDDGGGGDDDDGDDDDDNNKHTNKRFRWLAGFGQGAAAAAVGSLQEGEVAQ